MSAPPEDSSPRAGLFVRPGAIASAHLRPKACNLHMVKLKSSILLLLAGCLVAGVASFAAGCGGGSDSSSPTGGGGKTAAEAEGTAGAGKAKKPSGGAEAAKPKVSGGGGQASGSPAKTKFVKSANAICEQGRKKLLVEVVTYVKQHGGDPSAAGGKVTTEALQAVFLPKVQAQVDQIRALDPPAGDEAQVEAILDAMQAGIDKSKEVPVAPTNGFGPYFKRSAALAKDYGLESCAYG